MWSISCERLSISAWSDPMNDNHFRCHLNHPNLTLHKSPSFLFCHSPSWQTASDSTSPDLGLMIRIFLSLQVVNNCDPSQLKQALYTMSGWQSIFTRASPVPENGANRQSSRSPVVETHQRSRLPPGCRCPPSAARSALSDATKLVQLVSGERPSRRWAPWGSWRAPRRVCAILWRRNLPSRWRWRCRCGGTRRCRGRGPCGPPLADGRRPSVPPKIVAKNDGVIRTKCENCNTLANIQKLNIDRFCLKINAFYL